MAKTDNDSAKGASELASLFKSVIAAVGTFFGTLDRFGAGGALLLVGGVLLGIASVPWLLQRFHTQIAWLLRPFRGRTWAVRVTVGLGILSVILAGVFSFYSFVSIRVFRKEFTGTNDHIRIAVADYAQDHFKNVNAGDLRSQKGQEQFNLNQWIRWMINGARESSSAHDDKSEELKL